MLTNKASFFESMRVIYHLLNTQRCISLNVWVVLADKYMEITGDRYVSNTKKPS